MRAAIAVAAAFTLGLPAAMAQDPSPATLGWTVRDPEPAIPFLPTPSIGAQAGLVKARDADDPTYHLGVHVRFPIAEIVTLEGSIGFHTSEFADGDVEVTQYPVMATAYWNFDLGLPGLSPYLLGGVGLHFTDIEIDDDLGGDDDEDSAFGAHLGFGSNFNLALLNFNADLRYIFQEPDTDAAEDEEFDLIMFTVGITLPF